MHTGRKNKTREPILFYLEFSSAYYKHLWDIPTVVITQVT